MGKSHYQQRLENVMRFGGGMSRRGLQHTLILLDEATDAQLRNLQPDYSPIPCAMKCVYVREEDDDLLVDLITKCADKGININGGDTIDGTFERPLVLAATLGRYDLFTLLLKCGASPSETDGRGRNAFRAAFDHRDVTGWRHRTHEQELDQAENRLTIARHLLNNDFLTNCLCCSKANSNLLYVNAHSPIGSPLFASLFREGREETWFLIRDCGAMVTDTDWLNLRKLDKLQHLIYPTNFLSNNCWTFPPTYHVAIVLSNHCGLPIDVFHQHLEPFLTQDWFFSDEQFSKDLTTEEIRAEFGFPFR